MAANSLEQRVTALEAEVSDLRRRIAGEGDKPWWEKIAGSFAGDPIYLKAMELGRQYRESTRPKPKRKRGNARA